MDGGNEKHEPLPSRTKIPKFINGFNYIAPGIWERRPAKTIDPRPFFGVSSSSTSSSSSFTSIEFNSPDLILLFSWTGAVPQHISKYTTDYARLYPSTPIVLITTSLKDLAIRTSAQKQLRLQPAISLVQTYQANQPNRQLSILLHAFSEGGSNKAVEFAEAYYHHPTNTTTKLPVHAICLDSTPGTPRYWNLAAAFRKSLPNDAIIRFFGCLIGLALLAIMWILYILFFGREANVITLTRRRLNDPKYWDLNTTARCYLYSVADELIWWKDVEDHGVKAARLGVPTILVRFQDSPHCNHLKEDRQGYWEAVRATWEMRDVEIGLAI